MADQNTAPKLAQGDDPAALRAELAGRDEEILRLRDLLISRDAELGAAKGRLAMIEQGSQRIAEAATRIPIPGATRLIHGFIRFIQRSLR
jgi:hypothetical protein